MIESVVVGVKGYGGSAPIPPLKGLVPLKSLLSVICLSTFALLLQLPIFVCEYWRKRAMGDFFLFLTPQSEKSHPSNNMSFILV